MPSNTKLNSYKTSVTGANGDTVVTYHSTAVVTFNADRIILDTGGYRTVTTKRKMVQASVQFHLGYRVFSRAGKWGVVTARGDILPFDGKTLTFTRAGELVA